MLQTSLTIQHIKISLILYHIYHNQNIVYVLTLLMEADDPNYSFFEHLLSATENNA